MEKGFVCILKPASSLDGEFLRRFGDRFSVAERYGTRERTVLWLGDALPFPYRMGLSVLVGEESEYPVSTLEVRPSELSVTVRTDVFGFKSPFVGKKDGTVFISDSVRLLTEAAAYFGADFPMDESSVLAGIAYQSLPVGRTLLNGVSALP